jgi:apolipoprotein N-acyltransferase
MKRIMPGGSDFCAGTNNVLFSIPGHLSPFSVLICFENTFPYLARQAVCDGAMWLVNQTDDSWVDPRCGSRQQLANAIFRCIENRVPMVCCANTGVTCAIDRHGRINQTLSPRTAGVQIATIFPEASETTTFYTRYGDLFAQTCLIIVLVSFLLLSVKIKWEGKGR